MRKHVARPVLWTLQILLLSMPAVLVYTYMHQQPSATGCSQLRIPVSVTIGTDSTTPNTTVTAAAPSYTAAAGTNTTGSQKSYDGTNPEGGIAAAGSLGPAVPQQPHTAVVPDMQDRNANKVHPDVAQQVLQLERSKKGRKVISMSLFGTNDKFIHGVVENAYLAKRDWPGWVYRVYYGTGVPDWVLTSIEALGGELVSMTNHDVFQGVVSSTFWRFMALADPTATRVICRDADSRLTLRDKAAVDEWLQSGRLFHTMIDHPYHAWPVLAGMFGSVNGLIHPQMVRNLFEANQTVSSESGGSLEWFADQQWLKDAVWPLVKNHTLFHASYQCRKFDAAEVRGFPTTRVSPHDFVGNQYTRQNEWLGNTMLKPGHETCPLECRRDPSWEMC